MSKYFIFYFLIIIPVISVAQKQKEIDSLLNILQNQKEDTVKVSIYTGLCDAFRTSDPEKAMQYGEQGLKLSKELKYMHGIAAATQNIGLVFMHNGDYVNALKYLQEALEISEKLHNKNIESKCLFSIGNVQYYQKNYDNAYKYYKKSLKADEELGLKKETAICWINIGNVFKMKKEFPDAVKYYNNALKIFLELDEKLFIAGCYNNIARMYEKQKDYNSAVTYYQKAFSVNAEISDKKGQSMVLANMANLNNTVKNYKKAIENGLNALKISKEINDKFLECGICDILSESYDSLHNFKMALQYARFFIELNDSLIGVEKNKQLTEMETKYQTEKKQLEIDKLAKEKELQDSEMKKQRIIILFVVFGLFIVLGFLFVLFRLFLQKKKANILLAEQKKEIEFKNEALNQQNEEISSQRDEITAQRDEITAQRDLVTSQKEYIEEIYQEVSDSINYAKRIQQAVLPDLELGDWSLEFESFILFKPKNIVSGDFYWAANINEWLIVTVADCTGHGVPGAFMSMLGISFLNEIVRKKEISKASEVLDQLRTSVIDALKQKGESGEQKDGMDIALCAINMNTLEMQFAGANNPCYIIANTQPVIAMAQPEAISTAQSDCFVPRNNEYNFVDPVIELVEPVIELVEIKGDKQPIGIHSNMQPFTNQIFQLQKGNIIYLMSDGYEDQFGGPQRKKFLAKNLKNLLIANCQKRCIEPVEMPMAEQKEILEKTIENWKGINEQIDDITVMGIKI